MSSDNKYQRPIPLWDGWSFDGDLIYDPAGNKWGKNDLNSALMGKQLYNEISGTSIRIRSLKLELEKRIQAMAPPEITMHWAGQEMKVKFK